MASSHISIIHKCLIKARAKSREALFRSTSTLGVDEHGYKIYANFRIESVETAYWAASWPGSSSLRRKQQLRANGLLGPTQRLLFGSPIDYSKVVAAGARLGEHGTFRSSGKRQTPRVSWPAFIQ